MLYYDPQHVSSSTLLILRRILYGCLQRVMIPEAVVIQFVLLRMSSVVLDVEDRSITYILLKNKGIVH